jgi:RND superfamily putative drug exporter
LEDIQGFYLLDTGNETVFQNLSFAFMSADLQGSFISIYYNAKNPTDLGQYLRDAISSFHYTGSTEYTQGIEVGSSGFELFNLESRTSSEKDLVTVDLIAIFVTMFAFWLFLRSYELLIIPFLNLITALPYSLALLYPFCLGALEVSVVAPSIMLTMTLAFSTDYSLFFLTRFREELEMRGRTAEQAIQNSLMYAGNIILTSGSVLFITFAFLMTYKSQFLVGIGLGITLVVLMTIFVNLTLTPAMLLTFPRFFSRSSIAKVIQGGPVRFDPEAQKKHLWFRWASNWTRPARAFAIIGIVLLVTVPGIVYLFYMKTTIDTYFIVPKDSEALRAFNQLEAMIEPGKTAPFTVMTTISEGSVFSESFWNLTNSLSDYLHDKQGLKLGSNINSITYFGNVPIDYMTARSFLDPSFDPAVYNSSIAQQYRFIHGDCVSADQKSALMSITVDFNPISELAKPWIHQTLDNLEAFKNSKASSTTFWLYNDMVDINDLVDSIFSQFPFTIVANLVVLFILVAIVYRSFFIPLRATFTIGLSVAWAYGVTVIIYQYIKNLDIYWLGPVMAFSITTGLGLDYDIFLISKIVEYIENGFSTSAAITKGVYRTGNTITGAGVIMAVSFGGQLFSSIPLLNQYALIMFSAVILDTFVVRTAVVPAILQLLGYWNWWPGMRGQEPSNLKDESLSICDFDSDEDKLEKDSVGRDIEQS